MHVHPIRLLVAHALVGGLLLAPAGARADTMSPAGAEKATVLARDRRVTPERVLSRRAIGLGVAGAVFGAAWISVKGLATGSDLNTARQFATGESDPHKCIESCYIGPMFNSIASVLLIGAAGLLGGSVHAYGRLRGRQGRGPGGSARTGRILVGVGAGLIVGGLATLTGSLIAARSVHSAHAWVTTRELGWWSVTALGLSGAALTGLGHGVVRGHNERRGSVDLSLVPAFGQTGPGLALVGRF